MPDVNLTNMTPAQLDEFAAWCYLANVTDGVEVLDGADAHEVADEIPEHG